MAWAMAFETGPQVEGMTNELLRRRRAPMGGMTARLLPLSAVADAGNSNMLRITAFCQVIRMACLITPWPPWLGGRASSGRTRRGRTARPAASAEPPGAAGKESRFMSQTAPDLACQVTPSGGLLYVSPQGSLGRDTPKNS